jgi:hypothetical protein
MDSSLIISFGMQSMLSSIVTAHRVNGGGQVVFQFPNNRGASVVRHSFSYGASSGLFELAVIKFDGNGPDSWDIDYSTPITRDVLGWLSYERVGELLSAIKALPTVGEDLANWTNTGENDEEHASLVDLFDSLSRIS